MAKLKIEAKETYLEYGATLSNKLNPANVEIKILNGDELVAETTLESLVTKFLSISTEYMQAMAIIEKIKKQNSNIVLPGEQ